MFLFSSTLVFPVAVESVQSTTSRQLERRSSQRGPSLQTTVGNWTCSLNHSQTQEHSASVIDGLAVTCSPHLHSFDPTQGPSIITVGTSTDLTPTDHSLRSSITSSSTVTAPSLSGRPSLPPGGIAPVMGVQHNIFMPPAVGSPHPYYTSQCQTQFPVPSFSLTPPGSISPAMAAGASEPVRQARRPPDQYSGIKKLIYIYII